MINHVHLLELLCWADNVKVAHWQADTALNTHAALGALYDAATELTDDIAELAMGKTGSREFPTVTAEIAPGMALGELLTDGLDIVSACRAELATGTDDDLLNLLADLSAAITKAKYLLKL